jgi:hypothetical protein|tara:strand:- start:4311 stop:4739 length:429 start_codon:yes stop_codon:yes gene_type:complete
MKKISTLILAFAFIFNVSASNADLFSYDLSEIGTELSDLDIVENIIAQDQNSTVEEINTQITNNNFLSSSFETSYNSSLALRAGLIDDMDWGSFAWGFCCWPIGFFVVITNKDKDSNQKKSFWVGLGTSFVLSLISGAGASA